MNLIWLALQEHAAEGAQAAEHAPNVFSWAAGVSFWTVVIFLGLMAVLAKFAFPPILGYAAAREKRIQDSLDEARRQRAEAEALLEEQRRELAAARQEAQGLIAEAKQAADRTRQELLAQARTEQEELIARAKADIERERERALESVRREAVDIALAAAGRLVSRRLTADEDRRLVADYLGSLPATGPNGVN